MVSEIWNPHKKGEHVFNDIAGSLDNAFRSAVRSERARPLILSERYGSLELKVFPQTTMWLNRLSTDAVLAQARSVVAPATGILSDSNSRIYGDAAAKLQRVLMDLIVASAELLWRKRPHANSSFHHFESIVGGMSDIRTLKAQATRAVDALIDSGFDPDAEASALSERVAETELERRRSAISLMKQHAWALKETGHSLLTTFMDELNEVLERRIAAP